ncbi:MAG TPA: polyketide synthase dehydratase domain-containing protein, partial [Pirellulales bacterium]|nr:polyketide synthase dehydratase domain-containing protein [Pirellulales bacterium]
IDMQFMPAREGLEHLINELEIGAPEGEVLITDDRYYRAFYPAETLDEVANAKPPAGALLEGPVETIGSGKIRGSVRLDPAKDPFLVEHRLDDRPLLPVVIGMEMLCEAAAALDPAATVVELRNVEAMNGLRFHTDDPQTASITAERVDEQTVACLLSADFHTRTGALVDRDRPYLRGQVVLAAARSEIPVPRLPVPRQAWQKVSYAARGGKFFLGPPLRRLRKMIVGPTQAWGRIAAPALVELAGNRRDVRGWIFPSALVDACLYATGLLAWQSVQPGAHLPVSFGRIRLGTLPSPGEACIVESSYRGREGRTASFDFTLFGNDGRVVLAVEDYRIAWLA